VVLDFLWIVLGLLAAGALGSLVAWALLRGRLREEDAVVAGLRAQVEVLAQGQATLQQALTAISRKLAGSCKKRAAPSTRSAPFKPPGSRRRTKSGRPSAASKPLWPAGSGWAKRASRS
jgi:type II secretory pathway pseudopilin PulG